MPGSHRGPCDALRGVGSTCSQETHLARGVGLRNAGWITNVWAPLSLLEMNIAAQPRAMRNRVMEKGTEPQEPACAVRRGLRLSSGLRCTVSKPQLPGVHCYYVLAMPQDAPSSKELDEFALLAHRIGRLLSLQHFADPECYSLHYNAARTRRKAWPHFHLVVASSVPMRRREALFLQLKHILRWRRWAFLRRV